MKAALVAVALAAGVGCVACGALGVAGVARADTPAVTLPSGPVRFVVNTGAQWHSPAHLYPGLSGEIATLLRNAGSLPDIPTAPPVHAGLK